MDPSMRPAVEARNAADNAIYTASKLLRDHGETMADDSKVELELKLETLRRQLEEAQQAEPVQQATQELMDLVQSLDLNQGEASDGSQKPGETVEGEFNQI